MLGYIIIIIYEVPTRDSGCRVTGGESESANTKIKREETGERRASFPLPESLEQATWIVIY